MKIASVFKNAAIVGAFTSLSRVLGLAREMLQSRFIGAGVEQSAFTLAFALPNLARKLFGEGALTAAFVPVFKGELETQAIEKAQRLARAVMSMVLLMLFAIVAIGLISLEVFVGLEDKFQFGPRALLTIRLVQVLFPYMIFICAAALGMGVLNAMGKFKAASFMPCLLNFIWIGVLIWISFNQELSPEQRIFRVAVAILAAGAMQMIFMFYCMAKVGISPRFTFRGWKDSKVMLVWRNTAVAAVGAGAVQVNYLLDQVLGQVASSWAAGVIGYAERLMDLPLGVIGVAFGTVLLPTFAGCFAKNDFNSAQKVFISSVSQMLFIMIPAAVGLGILAPIIVEVVYSGGAFTQTDTIRVARGVAAYSFGLAFFGLHKALVPWFHAQNDMKTPLRISVYTVIINATLNISAVVILPEEWRHVGLAVSTVVCSGIGCVFLICAAHRRNGSMGLRLLAKPVFKILMGASVMSVGILLIKKLLCGLPVIVILTVTIILGVIIYFVFMRIMGMRLNLSRIK